MAPKYRLIYVNFRYAAESIRYLFAIAGVEYEDVRLEETKEWPAYKPKTPFGQIPVLEEDGELICDSQAIGRHLARKFGYAGKSEMEQTKVDMIMNCVADSMKPVYDILHEKDEKRKGEMTEKYQKEQLPQNLANFEKLLVANGSGYFVGDSLTMADIYFYAMSGYYKLAEPSLCLAKFPKLKELLDKIATNERVKKWEEIRPKTDL